MKKKPGFRTVFGKKTLLLAAVSLLLVTLIAIGATSSWIEDVSQVEFSTNNDSQETPLHVGDKILKSDAAMKNSTAIVALSDYFYASGDMHLSPCYGDGEHFYFPVEDKTTGNVTFRDGTKDDANVNYLSATFRIQSSEANTAYWFEKSGATNDTPFISFKKGDTAVTNSNLEQFLRFSVTIDGATNVYALNNDGTYYMVDSTTAAAAAAKPGKSIEQYTYYAEDFNQSAPEGYYKNNVNVTGKPNQGVTANLNGNTLFSVNTYDDENKSTLKTVTVKIWLEYNPHNSTKGVDIAAINMNLVSSWAKERRIYVKDATLHQENYTQAKWLSTQNAKLYWALKNDLSTHWELQRFESSDYYFVDIPAVYNNTPAVLFRCNGSWAAGSQTYPNSSVKYWDKWDTTFPDTFHSETFTVYSTDFGTWEETKNVHAVYFTNSNKLNGTFNDVYDYMWDSNSVHGDGINDKVVKNADWPGLKMTTKLNSVLLSNKPDTYVFYYNSDYNRIIFSDGFTETGLNREFQTQDLWLTDENGAALNLVDGTFDMATLTWFHTNPTKSDWATKMPSYSSANTYIHGNFVTGGRWVDYRFAYGGEYQQTDGNAFKDSGSTHMLCKIYIKHAGDYEFGLYYNGDWIGAFNDGDKRVCPYENYYVDGVKIPNEYGISHDGNHTSNFVMKTTKAGVIRIYLDTSQNKLYFADGEN